MTQLSPNTSIYAKALAKLKDINEQYSDESTDLPEDYIAAVQNIVHEVLSEGEKPNLFYDFIEKGEPTLSKDYNRFWRSMSSDVNIVYDQINYLKAHLVSSYNNVALDLKRATGENARVKGKLKTLQLYSKSVDNNTRIFGDFFSNYDSINLTTTPSETQAEISDGNILTLGKTTDIENLLSVADISVDAASNGFIGRNQEVFDLDSSPIDPLTGQTMVVFLAESYLYSDLRAIADSNPETWFEYEHNKVPLASKVVRSNFNFKYKNDLFEDREDFLDWASGPSNDKLELVIGFDLRSLKKASRISYTPHRISPQDIHPIKVKSVIVSSDGANWTKVSSGVTWIGNNLNLEGTSSNDSVSFNTAVWEFEETEIRYAKVEIEQSFPLASNIGHLWYREALEDSGGIVDPENSDDVSYNDELSIGPSRIEGPIPPLSSIADQYNPSFGATDNIEQRREVIEGERWAIGIRDISIENVKYQESSSVISKTFLIDGVVDRVSLEADYAVPAVFGDSREWVEFYVSPNKGLDWFQISNIQNDNQDIPEIIAFNDPLPEEFRETGVSYYSVKGVVNSLILRIDIKRPTDLKSSTPTIKNYQLKVLKR